MIERDVQSLVMSLSLMTLNQRSRARVWKAANCAGALARTDQICDDLRGLIA